MITKLVAFRIPTDLYETFQKRCSDEGTTVSERLRHFIDGYLSPSGRVQAAPPTETDEGKETNAELLLTLEERVMRAEEKILHLDEPLAEILDRLDNIERVLPGATGAGAEDRQVQDNPEEQKEELEKEPLKAEDESHWPYNVFFKEKSKEGKNENPWPFNLSFFKQEGE
jgi:hypothetical protein